MDTPTIEVVTPEMAKTWLGHAGRNRLVRKGRVEALARDMRNGLWRDNPQAIIIFDQGDELKDGQHRLAAVVEAGVAVRMYVLRGVNSNLMDVLDSGKSRTFGDRLSILRNVTDAQSVSSVCTWCWRYENNAMALGKSIWPTPSESLHWFDNNTGVVDSLVPARKVARNIRVNRTILAGVHYEALRVWPNETHMIEDFFTFLALGTDLETNDPILTLRNYFANLTVKRATTPQVIISAITIKAINAWMEAEAMSPRALRWRAVGPTREPFPKLGESELA